LNEVGHGLNEKIYENSLTVLFKLNNIVFDQQRRFPVHFVVLKSASSFPISLPLVR